MGDYEGAARVGGTVDAERLANRERRAMLYADMGRALAHIPGRQRVAVTALAMAARTPPQRIRNSPARHAVEGMLNRAKAEAVEAGWPRGWACRTKGSPLRAGRSRTRSHSASSCSNSLFAACRPSEVSG